MPKRKQEVEPQVAPGGVADLTVQVTEGSTASHNGEQFSGGDTFKVEGLTAISLAQTGAVTILGEEEE